MQCLTSPIITGSPFPSHPTVRSVFPNTAVRQSSSHVSTWTMACCNQRSARWVHRADDSHRLPFRFGRAEPAAVDRFPRAGPDKSQATARGSAHGSLPRSPRPLPARRGLHVPVSRHGASSSDRALFTTGCHLRLGRHPCAGQHHPRSGIAVCPSLAYLLLID